MRKTHHFAHRVVIDPVEAIKSEIYGHHALEACARAIGVSHQLLSRQLNDDEHTALSLRRGAALADFLDTDALALCLAARRGGVFVKLPSAEAAHASDVVAEFSRVVKEFSDVGQATAKATADGSIKQAEVDELRKEAHDLWAAMERLLYVAEQKAARP